MAFSPTSAPNTDIADSLLATLRKIKDTFHQNGKRTALPDRTFSDALNAIGEPFVHRLLATEPQGEWWLGENGDWCTCQVLSARRGCGTRFLPSERWGWWKEPVEALGDPMTEPDHLVEVKVGSDDCKTRIVVEQKLRFSSPGDAVGSPETYFRHLTAELGKRSREHRKDELQSWLTGSIRDRLANGERGKGTTPEVVYASLTSDPRGVVLENVDKPCMYAGFLAPTRAESFKETPELEILVHSGVRLWIGLDDLIDAAEARLPGSVQRAFEASLDDIKAQVVEPTWTEKQRKVTPAKPRQAKLG